MALHRETGVTNKESLKLKYFIAVADVIQLSGVYREDRRTHIHAHRKIIFQLHNYRVQVQTYIK